VRNVTIFLQYGERKCSWGTLCHTLWR